MKTTVILDNWSEEITSEIHLKIDECDGIKLPCIPQIGWIIDLSEYKEFGFNDDESLILNDNIFRIESIHILPDELLLYLNIADDDN